MFEVVDGVAEVILSDEILIDAQPLWSAFVVGHFIRDAPHVRKIHAMVNRLWSSTDKPHKIDVQILNTTTILFCIENETARSRVLKRHFWYIADVPLIVTEWNPETTHLKPDLESIPIWVDFKDVPGHLFSQKELKFLESIVGKAIKLHPQTEHCLRLDMARVLVKVNLKKPLPDKINLKQS